jgi:hypothetical protein
MFVLKVQVVQPKFYVHLSSAQCMLNGTPISFLYLISVMLSMILLLPLLDPNIHFGTLAAEILNLCSSHRVREISHSCKTVSEIVGITELWGCVFKSVLYYDGICSLVVISHRC